MNASNVEMQARTEFARAMTEKDEDYRRRELELQERHSRELAKKSRESAQDMMMARPGEEEEGAVPQGRGGSGAAEPGARERKSSKVRHSVERPVRLFMRFGVLLGACDRLASPVLSAYFPLQCLVFFLHPSAEEAIRSKVLSHPFVLRKLLERDACRSLHSRAQDALIFLAI